MQVRCAVEEEGQCTVFLRIAMSSISAAATGVGGMALRLRCLRIHSSRSVTNSTAHANCEVIGVRFAIGWLELLSLICIECACY